MIHRLLVATRGEIAVRVLRTAQRLGIETVAAVSEADRESLPARLADTTVVLGPARPSGSYLSVDAVLRAARAARVDAVHPGYGFLSESPALASACEDAGMVFVGPTPQQLSAVGDKVSAREHALAAGLPLVAGTDVRSAADVRRLTDEVGLPVLVKAVGGGGGRGMRVVRSLERVDEVLDVAVAEAQGAFGDPRIYAERYVERARHVEVQILGDGATAMALGTRDCSVQRRHQKLVEEAPAPLLPPGMSEQMEKAAVALATHLRYRGLGTVELLYDVDARSFAFLEMNARIQVEHPVTEAVFGLDLVAEQLSIAEGQPVTLRPGDSTANGHAVECRVNAEDPAAGFRPSPGRVTRAQLPVGPGIRVDTYLYPGCVVPPYYDSLVAKVIASAPSRDEAFDLMASALQRVTIEGVATNVALLGDLVGSAELRAGGVDTAWLERRLDAFPEEVP